MTHTHCDICGEITGKPYRLEVRFTATHGQAALLSEPLYTVEQDDFEICPECLADRARAGDLQSKLKIFMFLFSKNVLKPKGA